MKINATCNEVWYRVWLVICRQSMAPNGRSTQTIISHYDLQILFLPVFISFSVAYLLFPIAFCFKVCLFFYISRTSHIFFTFPFSLFLFFIFSLKKSSSVTSFQFSRFAALISFHLSFFLCVMSIVTQQKVVLLWTEVKSNTTFFSGINIIVISLIWVLFLYFSFLLILKNLSYFIEIYIVYSLMNKLYGFFFQCLRKYFLFSKLPPNIR